MAGKLKWAFPSFIVIVMTSIFFVNFSEENPDSTLFKALQNKNAISSIKIPEEIYFANERVPLENFDTRESLERELIVNTYWHSQTLLLLKKSKRYFPIIDSILTKYKVPLDFKYMAVAESGLSQVVSPSNAVGFWQFLEGTARDYGLEVNDMVDERYHIEKSTEAACKYLIHSYQKFGSWTLAAASYNRGRRFLDNQIKIQKQNNYYDLLLGEEGERYVFRIIALKMLLENPNDYGFIMENDGYVPIPYYNYTIDSTIYDFGVFAREKNINYKLLKMFNPWLRKSYLKIYGNKTYTIKIPFKGYRNTESYEIDTSIFAKKK